MMGQGVVWNELMKEAIPSKQAEADTSEVLAQRKKHVVTLRPPVTQVLRKPELDSSTVVTHDLSSSKANVVEVSLDVFLIHCW